MEVSDNCRFIVFHADLRRCLTFYMYAVVDDALL